jgi:hypothetical protein
MLKLKSGFSRKVGEPNYGSRGACVDLEVELESSLVGDADGLLNRVRSLFALARRAVEEELAAPDGDGHATAVTRASAGNGQGNSNGNGVVRGRAVPAATAAQSAAIRALCLRLGFSPDRLVFEHYGVNRPEELHRQEASALIDELKAQTAAGREGGGQ